MESVSPLPPWKVRWEEDGVPLLAAAAAALVDVICRFYIKSQTPLVCSLFVCIHTPAQCKVQIKDRQRASFVGESEGQHRHLDTSVSRCRRTVCQGAAGLRGARFASHDGSFQRI